MARQYGPPAPPVPWPTVTVGHEKHRDGERLVYQDPKIVQQRRQLNALAYLNGSPS